MKDRPQGYSLEEAAQVASEHEQSPDVQDARIVTFADVTNVHLDLQNGDLVVIGPNECLHIECQ